MTYTPEQLTEAADILDKAHDIILERGWWGMRQRNELTSLCIEAAIIEAANGEEVTCPTLTFRQVLLAEALPPRIPEWMAGLYEGRGINFLWNDETGRTEDEVFDRLRSVAKELREEAGAS